MLALAPNLPGRKLTLLLIRTVRIAVTIYIAGLSIAMPIISAILGHVGGIIASVYIIPASLFFVALELGYLRSRISPLHFEMHPIRILILQFLSAMIAGVGWLELIFFIFGCVAFGVTIGLMNLIGFYYLCWGTTGQEGGNVWSLNPEKSSRTIFLAPEEEDALLVDPGSPASGEVPSVSESSGRRGPEVHRIG